MCQLKIRLKRKALGLNLKGVIDLQLLITCRREFHDTGALIWQKHAVRHAGKNRAIVSRSGYI